VPSVCRRIVALVAVACLGLTAAVPMASAQDEPTLSATTPTLSPSPVPSETTPTSTTSTTTTATPPTTSSRARQLPETGLDARGLVLLGAALLLGGLGLRLRSAPERF
jgi:LPXTG-motif cell wall-anchored protein